MKVRKKLTRPVLLMLLLAGALFTAGCSLWNTIDSSLDYVNEATSYVNDATAFAQGLPDLAQQAVLDPAARDQLEQSFVTMKDNITAFNGLTAPEFASEIHQKLLSYNETLLAEINTYLEQLKTNVIDLEALQQSPMMQTLSNITDTLGQLKELGQ
ncbi:hypothetical protein FHS18_004901 [Paenibacillus phyllosphaerae]|uniref:Lipoprotein n=1 Tax=Paenibacillus phyllosphaerae TaxID=274593 RepID=A0A7W5FQ97_9BACL|nr:DUF6376 family protein [Paenibacillus phyllosphaerae]MBB3112799.1 hypothetical protein [Paenibacillus phyllosphaerae]